MTNATIGTGELIDTAELLRLWREHDDQQARQLFIARHVPLARKLARRYTRGAPEPSRICCRSRAWGS